MGMGRLFSVGALSLLLVAAGYFVFQLVMYHRKLHAANSCTMTFMYRRIFLMPIPVPEYNGNRYSLLHYTEGVVFPPDFVGGPADIPVLFVPGSGGSGAQVRSLASVMQNKTEMRRAPFRMHFYALNFEEEMSFLSGNTLIRQREFLMKSIKVLRERYPFTADKMVLFGHSFGGVVIRSLPLHPEFQPNFMGIVLTLAAPLLHSPLVLDLPMANFYNEVEEYWENPKGLEHITFISVSGGEKDFLVPDRLVEADNSIHLPSWSIPGVATPVDHLCILWCNQLVRYTSRILFIYGENALSQENPNLTIQTINRLQEKLKARNEHLTKIITHSNAKKSSIDEVGVFGTDSNTKATALRLNLPVGQLYRIHVQCKDQRGYSCSEKLRATILHGNGWQAFGENSLLHGIRVKTAPFRSQTGKESSYLILEASEDNIDYVVTVEADFMASWYMVSTSYAFNIISTTFFTILLAIPLVETSLLSVPKLAIVLLATSALGIVFLIFHYIVIVQGIAAILLLIANYQPVLRVFVGKLSKRYLSIVLALLHPHFAAISTILRHPKARFSVMYQLCLALSMAVIIPSIFEGGWPRLVLPGLVYSVVKNITIINPTWLFVAADLTGSKKLIQKNGIISKTLAFVTAANFLVFALSSHVFEETPLIFYPMTFSHILLFFSFLSMPGYVVGQKTF